MWESRSLFLRRIVFRAGTFFTERPRLLGTTAALVPLVVEGVQLELVCRSIDPRACRTAWPQNLQGTYHAIDALYRPAAIVNIKQRPLAVVVDELEHAQFGAL